MQDLRPSTRAFKVADAGQRQQDFGLSEHSLRVLFAFEVPISHRFLSALLSPCSGLEFYKITSGRDFSSLASWFCALRPSSLVGFGERQTVILMILGSRGLERE
jgi:hypothetical protein